MRPIRSDDAQWLNHSAGTPRAPLVKASLLRNLDIADKLGVLTPDNLALIRRGHSPIITRGPYAGEPAEVDHIIPLAIAPEVDKEIANLELLPRSLNRRKGATVGDRQLDYARRFRAAGLLDDAALARVEARRLLSPAEMQADDADRGIENVHPYVNSICAFWGNSHGADGSTPPRRKSARRSNAISNP